MKIHRHQETIWIYSNKMEVLLSPGLPNHSADYTGVICLPSDLIENATKLLHCAEYAIQEISLHINDSKTELDSYPDG